MRTYTVQVTLTEKELRDLEVSCTNLPHLLETDPSYGITLAQRAERKFRVEAMKLTPLLAVDDSTTPDSKVPGVVSGNRPNLPGGS